MTLIIEVWESCNPFGVLCFEEESLPYWALFVAASNNYFGYRLLLLLNRLIIWCRIFQKRMSNLGLVNGDRKISTKMGTCHVSLINLTKLIASSNCLCRSLSWKLIENDWMDMSLGTDWWRQNNPSSQTETNVGRCEVYVRLNNEVKFQFGWKNACHIFKSLNRY